MFDVARSTFNVKDALAFCEFWREAIRTCGQLLLAPLQFTCAFREALLRSGESGIELEHLPEES